MKFNFPFGKRLLRWIITTIIVLIMLLYLVVPFLARYPGYSHRILVLVVLLYLVVPFAGGFFATRRIKASVGAPPNGFEEITLATEDNLQLAAWYTPPQNGAAIILIHGAGDSRESMRPYAEMLVRHGYGVLVVDLRGHGESKGNTNRFGWKGTRDVGAAVQFLRQQAVVELIGGLGSYLGGEALLGAAADYPELRAIVSEGATARCNEDVTDLDYPRPLHYNFTLRVMYFAAGLFSGDEPPTPIVDSISAADSTRFLFIVTENDNLAIDYNELFKNTVGERGTFWIAREVDHTSAFHRYTDEYEQRLIEFFERNLLHS